MPIPTSGIALSPRRWLMWALPAFLFLIGFFHRAAPGVIARDVMQAFGGTGGTAGLVAAPYCLPCAGGAALVALVGWRGALAGVGVATLGGAALCLLLVRDRPAGAPAPAGADGLRAVLGGAGRVLRNPHTWPPFLAFFCLYSVLANQMQW